jgi:hypothetical protein
MRFIASAGKDWELIESYLSSTNAHDILDKIEF